MGLRRTAAFALGLAAVTALPTIAAAENSGWYLGLSVGANLADDGDLDAAGVPGDIDYDAGWGVLGQVGWGFEQYRFEGELGWRENGIDSIGSLDSNGDVDVFTAMVNAYYDFPVDWAVVPYIGVGVGGARIDVDNATLSGLRVLDDSDWVLAYQGIVGASYEIDENWLLKADYRYLATNEAEFRANDGTRVDADYDTHSIMVGFSYRFGAPRKPMAVQAAEPAPAPVPAPAPAPEPAAEMPRFLVFFDFDSAELSEEAREVLSSAAAIVQRGGAANVQLTGHADRSGSDAYNQRLSLRRAQAVQQFLVTQGLAPSDVGISAQGESNPLVATPDGVREPQNRRVEIEFR